MYVLIALSTIPLALFLGTVALLFTEAIDRNGMLYREAPLPVIIRGLIVSISSMAVSVLLLSSQDSVWLRALGALTLSAVLAVCIVGGAGICIHLTQRWTRSESPQALIFLSGLALTTSMLIPIVGWFLFTPIFLFASCGVGVQTIRTWLKERHVVRSNQTQIGSWLGMSTPAWFLFFLSPVVGELLSGSAPPVEFFQPFSLLILSALYGSGAVLIRELTFRWEKGWRTIVILGVAYAIVEEGLMVKSFFDPSWMDLGPLGTYGRWLGVNWIWSLELIVYHAVFSIAIPIILVDLLFPKEKQRSWVSLGAFRGLSILLTLDVLLGSTLLTTYRPPIGPYLLAIGAVIVLYFLAKKQPTQLKSGVKGQTMKAGWVGLIAFVGTLGLFLISWILPTTNLPAILTFLILVVWVVLILGVVGWLLGWGKASWRHRFSVAVGGLSFFILITPIQELDTSRLDNPSGMILIGILFAIFLVYIGMKARKVNSEISIV